MCEVFAYDLFCLCFIDKAVGHCKSPKKMIKLPEKSIWLVRFFSSLKTYKYICVRSRPKREGLEQHENK